MGSIGIASLIDATEQDLLSELTQLERKRLLQAARDEHEELKRQADARQKGVASMIWCIVHAAGGEVRITEKVLQTVAPASKLTREVDEETKDIIFRAMLQVAESEEGHEAGA